MKALSVRQPWASLIVLGIKDVENRTWRTNYRGPLAIHASQRVDDATGMMHGLRAVQQRAAWQLMATTGAIIGQVDLVDCVNAHHSRLLRQMPPPPCLRPLPLLPPQGLHKG
jgi:hypothetical protein